MFAACLAGLLAVGTVPLFQVWQARTRAERIADQVAVLVAEGRPLPASVTRGVRGGLCGERGRVPVTLAGHPLDVTATARTP